MSGACEAAASKTDGRHGEVPAVFLDHDVSGQLRGAEQTVQRGIDATGLVDAGVVLRPRVVVARVMLDKRKIVRGIPIHLVRAHEDERRFRAETASRFEQRQRPARIHIEIVEWPILGEVVRRLSRAVDHELRPQRLE